MQPAVQALQTLRTASGKAMLGLSNCPVKSTSRRLPLNLDRRLLGAFVAPHVLGRRQSRLLDLAARSRPARVTMPDTRMQQRGGSPPSAPLKVQWLTDHGHGATRSCRREDSTLPPFAMKMRGPPSAAALGEIVVALIRSGAVDRFDLSRGAHHQWKARSNATESERFQPSCWQPGSLRAQWRLPSDFCSTFGSSRSAACWGICERSCGCEFRCVSCT